MFQYNGLERHKSLKVLRVLVSFLNTNVSQNGLEFPVDLLTFTYQIDAEHVPEWNLMNYHFLA